jgi:Plant transposon protein
MREKQIAVAKERVRKDIEAAFGMLVQRLHKIQRPMRGWFWRI